MRALFVLNKTRNGLLRYAGAHTQLTLTLGHTGRRVPVVCPAASTSTMARFIATDSSNTSSPQGTTTASGDGAESPLLPPLPQTPSYAFSGCGWLVPFFFGIIEEMRAAGHMNNNTLVSGTSGGAIAATVAVSGIDAKYALEHFIELAKLQRKEGDDSAAYDMDTVLKTEMAGLLRAHLSERDAYAGVGAGAGAGACAVADTEVDSNSRSERRSESRSESRSQCAKGGEGAQPQWICF